MASADAWSSSQLDRMQASALEIPIAQTTTPDSKTQATNHPAGLQSHGQAKTVPNLLLSMPPTSNSQPSNSMASPETTNDTLASGGTISAMEGDDSDRSSICRSPGWDDTKKRRKGKQKAKDTCRREKEKSAMEAKKPRPQNRLTKAPPGISKPSMVHSEPAPVLLALSAPTNLKDKLRSGEGRTSNDAGPRKFIPWTSASAQPRGVSWLKNTESFIGGVKLQQAIYATVQPNLQNQTTLAVDSQESKFAEEFSVAEHDVRQSTSDLQDGELDSVTLPIRPKGPTFDQPSFSSRISSKAGDSTHASEACVPTMERKIKRGRKGKSSGLESTIRQALVSSQHIAPGSEASRDLALPRSPTEHNSSRRSQMQSSASSSERPPISYREPPQLAETKQRPRQGSFSFLRGQSQQIKDQLATASHDASTAVSATSTERHSRSKSWSFHKGSMTSLSGPPTADSIKSNSSKSEATHQTSRNSNGRPTPPSDVAGSLKESLPPSGNISRLTSLQFLKSSAKTAFSRHSYSPKSVSIPLSASELLVPTEDHPISIKLPSSNQVSQSAPQPSRKPERTTHEIRPGIYDHNMQYASPGRTGALIEPSQQSNLASGQSSNSSSLNDSSNDYYSTFDEPTNVPMPASSMPLSEKSVSGAVGDKSLMGDPTTHSGIHSVPSDPVESGFIEQEERSERKSSCISSSSTSPPSPTNTQNLSFLPTLKHQSLPRPAKGKGKEISSATYTYPLAQNLPSPLNRLRPLTPPESSSSSSSSSPTSPITTNAHSKYLHTARKNLPPPSLASRSSLHISQESNTRAKMFVICCNCRYFHDMPSKIYECMAKPDGVVTDSDLGVSGVISMAVKCPWCSHGMSSRCCEGWAAVVVLRERLH